MAKILTLEQFKTMLAYDSATGVFTWTVNKRGNTKQGAVAGTINWGGYRVIASKRKIYYAHRLAWLYMTGSWPESHLDHIDGNKLNNRFDNLRESSKAQNGWNTLKKAGHSSRFKGVCYSKRRGHLSTPWIAQIVANGIHHYLGCFHTEEEAHSAYCHAGTSLHGEFFNSGNPHHS